MGEAESIPVADESVDYVFANMFLHHIESPLKTICEMTRPLKKGGKLIITDLDEHECDFLKVEQHDRWMGFDREVVKVWFEEAGLRDVVVKCVGSDCCSDSLCGEQQAKISIFAACGVK